MLNYHAEVDPTPSPDSLSWSRKVEVLLSGVSVPRPRNGGSLADLGLPVDTVRFAAADGVRLEGWWMAPPNPRGTVLLFPGYAAPRSSLLPEAQAFHAAGFAVLLIDFRGSGGSDGSSNSVGYHEANDVLAAVRYARERGVPGPLVLYGQSMGGAAVLRAVAVLGVRPDGLIVEAVFGRVDAAVRNRFALMGVPSFPAAELLVFWGGVRAGLPAFEHNPVDYARACECPVLVLHGEADRHARPEEGRAIFGTLRGPKELVMFPNAGHRSLLAVAPDRWREAVGGFLARQIACPPGARAPGEGSTKLAGATQSIVGARSD